MKGKIVAFEGIDGSGKNTQSALLADKLHASGFDVFLMGFPCYTSTFFGKQVGRYLNGEFGSLQDVDPRLAAILYAGDRYEMKKSILDNLNDGKIVVIDRYVSSNIAHQAAKAPTEKQNDLVQWIEELEYKVFGLPKPDVHVLLNINATLSNELVLKKKARDYTDLKQDIHEEDGMYLGMVAKFYHKLASVREWEIIECIEDEQMREIPHIADEVYRKVINTLKF